MTARPARNRTATQDALIGAAGEVLARGGFQDFGVNAVARAAGCDKQLIYRYFGGLDGLVAALGARQSEALGAALEAQAPPGPPSDYPDLINGLVLAYLDVLTANVTAQKLVLWELCAPAPALSGFARGRARMIAGWIARRQGALTPPPGIDALAVNALLIAAVHQIVLARSASQTHQPASSGSDAAWARARAALSHLGRRALSS
ncbi:MAG: TetR family transcriptional regulator [Alphaproteobacteria bacterium]|nr:TetR family transcriptional regulator [Alphaproteobacteria bacterium]